MYNKFLVTCCRLDLSFRLLNALTVFVDSVIGDDESLDHAYNHQKTITNSLEALLYHPKQAKGK